MTEAEEIELERIIEEEAYPTVYDSIGINMDKVVAYIEAKKILWEEQARTDELKNLGNKLADVAIENKQMSPLVLNVLEVIDLRLDSIQKGQ